MKPWRNARDGKTGSATNGHCLLAKRWTNSELEYSSPEFVQRFGNNRKRDERALLIGETLDEFRAGIFRNIELLATRHAVENGPRLIDCNEIELDAVRPDLAGIERLHAVVEPARERKLQLGHGGVPQVPSCAGLTRASIYFARQVS